MDGELRPLNLLRFFIQVCITILNIACILLCMYYAHLANVNVGVMTAIWGVQPLFAAFLDWVINGEPFLLSYAIGIVMMIGCAVCISFKQPADVAVPEAHIEVTGFPVWPAILLGFITPCVFCT